MTRSPAGSATTSSSEISGTTPRHSCRTSANTPWRTSAAGSASRGPTASMSCTIEHLRFTDATLTPVDDGNPLFDALYYYSRNTDVYFAGVDALAHFNAFGRHEGRDPNAFFDTSGYLAVNKDVAAIGANPLDHYHQGGWQQGRDPSAWFDTTLYLIRNPDVAAAGVDPLAHFSAVRFRGRAPGAPGDRSEHRRRLRRAILPVPQSRRGGGRRRSARALRRLRLARGAQSECLVRHRGLSRALRRRRRRGRQSARRTTCSSAGRKGATPRRASTRSAIWPATPTSRPAGANPLAALPAVRHLRRPAGRERRGVALGRAKRACRGVDGLHGPRARLPAITCVMAGNRIRRSTIFMRLPCASASGGTR